MRRRIAILALGCALALALAAAAQEKVEDLQKRVRQTLATPFTADMENAELEDFIGTCEKMFKERLSFFIDPTEVNAPAELKITCKAQDTLEGVLKKSLKPKNLIPFVWEGVIVITSEKGTSDFKNADWSGLTEKAVSPHARLRERLSTVYDFDWSPFDPRKGLETLSRKSGAEIAADKLGTLDLKNPDKHLLYPRKVALRTALVCLARVTGITYQVGRDGGLIALPPEKQKGARAPAVDGPIKLALSLATGDRFTVSLSERLGQKDDCHTFLDRQIEYQVAEVSPDGVATVNGVYRKFGFDVRAIFDGGVEPEDVVIVWENGNYLKRSKHRLYSALVDNSIRAGVQLRMDRRGRARQTGKSPIFRSLEMWGAAQLLGLPGCLPERPLEAEETWSYEAKSPPTRTEGKLVRSEADIAVLAMKLESSQKFDSGAFLETRMTGDVVIRFDIKRGLPREMKGTCRQSVIRNDTTTALDVPGSELQVEAMITPAK